MTQVLLTDPSELKALSFEAQRLGPRAEQWALLAEAILRIDVAALPIHGSELPRQTREPTMPWDRGWELLLAHHPAPDDRIALAANLLCRTERARMNPDQDWAADWLQAPTGHRSRQRSESLARELVPDADVEKVLEQVQRVVSELSRRPKVRGSATALSDTIWRNDAVRAARSLVAESRRGSPRTLGGGGWR